MIIDSNGENPWQTFHVQLVMEFGLELFPRWSLFLGTSTRGCGGKGPRGQRMEMLIFVDKHPVLFETCGELCVLSKQEMVPRASKRWSTLEVGWVETG